MRCFVAVELEPGLRRSLARFVKEKLPPGGDVRPCTEDQLHVTLKFLGELTDQAVQRACQIVQETVAQIEPFTIAIGGLGCFPPKGLPRVLWCGVQDTAEACVRWVELADPQFAELGVEREQRRYTPHITLGRSKSPRGGETLRTVLQTAQPPQLGEMRVERLTLFESRLERSGAKYVSVVTAQLATQRGDVHS